MVTCFGNHRGGNFRAALYAREATGRTGIKNDNVDFGRQVVYPLLQLGEIKHGVVDQKTAFV